MVNLQSALNLSTAVDDGAMVAATNHLTYAYGRNLGIFLCEVHRHLTRHDKLALAAAAVCVVCAMLICKAVKKNLSKKTAAVIGAAAFAGAVLAVIVIARTPMPL